MLPPACSQAPTPNMYNESVLLMCRPSSHCIVLDDDDEQ